MTLSRYFSKKGVLAFALPVLMVLVIAPPVAAQDSSDFFLRLNQLENQVRELSGTIEKLEYDNRRLQEQLNRFQEDVEFRFQENAGSHGAGAPAPKPKQKRSDVMPASPASPLQIAKSDVKTSQTAIVTPHDADRRTSLLQKGHLDLAEEANAAQGTQYSLDADTSIGITANMPLQNQTAQLPAVNNLNLTEDAADIRHTAETLHKNAQAAYHGAEGLMRRQQFEQAEIEFRQFLKSHPRNKLVPDATFNIGESLFFRGQYRKAAEEYLRLTTAYPDSALAPMGMLKLGMSLEALGARDQACATFAETVRKFPNGSPELMQGLARGRIRANCN